MNKSYPNPAHTISRFKKERFLRGLSEKEFRDTVVRPLFLRLGFGDGRDTCGPQEAGKDALFTETDAFGVESVVALQTKAGNLNLASSAAQNLIHALTQVQTALETEVTLLATKQRVTPLKVYLCASGRINDAAREHILSKTRNPNVLFLDSAELIPRIDEHIPEVWLGIEADLLPYFQGIKQLVEGDGGGGSGIGLALPGGAFGSGALDETFVPLNLHRTRIRQRKIRGRFHPETTLESFPLTSSTTKKYRRLLVCGEAGSGKSTGLLRLAYELARNGIGDGGNYRIPVLLRALDLHSAEPSSLYEYSLLACRLISRGERPCFTADDLVQGRVVLLVDSLDELPSDASRTRILDLIESLLIAYPKTQVVITARQYNFVRQLPQLKLYDEFRISPINWRQATKIVRSVRKGEGLSQAQANEMLRQLDRIHGVELNPLLVTVYAATTDFARKDIPANITELFKKFTELMLGRWDEQKGLTQQFHAPLKDFMLTQLAYEMHKRRKTSIARADAEMLAHRELLSRGYSQDASALLSEIFDRSGLFRVVDDEVEFRHLLLQEFFAGRGVESGENAKEFLTDDWWKRALVFYFGDNPTRVVELAELTRSVRSTTPQEAVTAATTVGLALQACYLSQVPPKLEVWQWVVDALSEALEGYVRSLEAIGDRKNLGFVQYYLVGRDAVALSNIRENVVSLMAWSETTSSALEPMQVSCDLRRFWLSIGLMEAGDLDCAEEALAKFAPKDLRLLLAVHLGAHLAYRIRPIDKSSRKIAQRIGERLGNEIEPLREQLRKEIGSMLIEFRDGSPQSIESEAEQDGDD